MCVTSVCKTANVSAFKVAFGVWLHSFNVALPNVSFYTDIGCNLKPSMHILKQRGIMGADVFTVGGRGNVQKLRRVTSFLSSLTYHETFTQTFTARINLK